MQINRVRAETEINLFKFITLHLKFRILIAIHISKAPPGRVLLCGLAVLGVGAGGRVAVSTAISGREPGAVLLCGPTADGGTHGLTVLGCELAEVQSVGEGAVSGE